MVKLLVFSCRSSLVTHFADSFQEDLSLLIGYFRDRSRSSGKGFHTYKGVGFALLIISHFS